MTTRTDDRAKIALIVGSIRQNRSGSAIGRWVEKEAQAHLDGVDVDLLELADFDVPLLTDPVPPGAAQRQYADERVRAWGRAIDEYDGFVFITPEYNHGVPGAFKNAFDSLYPEWNHKSVGFIAYGADGGVRAVEHWRSVVANAHLVAVRAQLSLSLFTDFEDGSFAPGERRVDELRLVLDQVTDMAKVLKPLRD